MYLGDMSLGCLRIYDFNAAQVSLIFLAFAMQMRFVINALMSGSKIATVVQEEVLQCFGHSRMQHLGPRCQVCMLSMKGA